MSRASSRPAMTSIGKPSAASALGRNWAMFFATRKVLVATARTCSGAKPRNRSPNWARHSKARVWLSSSRFLLASKPPAKRTICLMFSTSCGCPLLFWQICRRKLLEPKSTEARREARFSIGGFLVGDGGGMRQPENGIIGFRLPKTVRCLHRSPARLRLRLLLILLFHQFYLTVVFVDFFLLLHLLDAVFYRRIA